MPRLRPVDADTHRSLESRELLETYRENLGTLPAVIRTLAHSPAALKAFMEAELALSSGSLSEPLRRQVGLLAAEVHGCPASLALRAALGRSAGLGSDQIADGRRGASPDRRVDAALRFVRALLDGRGRVEDADVERLRKAGFRDAEVVELVATATLALCADYLNLLADAEPDFPPPAPLP
jgi:alkylhydroperoxidase family enzyme